MTTLHTIDEFIEKSKQMIGKEVDMPETVNALVKRRKIDQFTSALGMESLLADDPNYASSTRYGCLLAPQTFLASVRWPIAEGDYANQDYGLAAFCTGVQYQWFDVIRCGETFTAELKLKEVYERKSKFYEEEKRVAVLVSEASYWNRGKELVGKAIGTMSMVPINRGQELLLKRNIYEYTKDQIDQIAKDIDEETSRGDTTLYWEDMKEGDQLPQVVKGPAQLADIFCWRGSTAGRVSLQIGYRRALNEPGNKRINPTTKWPYFHAANVQNDRNASRLDGIPEPSVHGLHRASMAEHLLTNWMSVDGFIRQLDFEILKPFMYGDTNWYKAVVNQKYKEKVGGVMYNAAEIQIDVTNQLGEKTATGNATVYLPSRGHPVKLPIPQ